MKTDQIYKHSFAKQFLNYNGIELYQGDKRILEYDGNHPKYDIFDLDTGFYVQEEKEEVQEIRRIDSYAELLELGLGVISKPGTGAGMFAKQRVIYELVKLAENTPHIGVMPMRRGAHYVELDIINKKARLVGRNAGYMGKGPWISLTGESGLTRSSPEKKKFSISDYEDKTEEILSDFEKKYVQMEEEPKFVKIPELAVMISDANEIVCIPHNLRDPPSIGIFGQRRSGKCLDGDTTIIIPEDENLIVPIKDIYENKEKYINKKVYSIDDDFNIKQDRIIDILKTDLIDKKAIIKTRTNKILKSSLDHKWLVLNKEYKIIKKYAKDLEKGDYLVSCNKLSTPTTNYSKSFDDGFLEGIYLAEGHILGSNILISNMDEGIRKVVEYICRKKGYNLTIKKKFLRMTNCKDYSRYIKENFKTGSGNKDIPHFIFHFNEEYIKGLLSGYMSGDGCINKSDFGFTTKSKKLRDKLNLLFLRIGILCTKGSRQGNGKYKDNTYFTSNILDKIRFKEEIFIADRRKSNVLLEKKVVDSLLSRIPLFYKNTELGKNRIIEGMRKLKLKGWTERKTSELLDLSTLGRSPKFGEVLEYVKENPGCNSIDLGNSPIFKAQNLKNLKQTSFYLERLYKEGLLVREKKESKWEKNFRGKERERKISLKTIKHNGGKRCIDCGNFCTMGVRCWNCNIKERIRNAKIKPKKVTYEQSYRYFFNKMEYGNNKRKEDYVKSITRESLKNFIRNDTMFDKVESINIENNKEPMYDLSIENNHNFLTEDLIFTSNSFLSNRIIGQFFWKQHKRVIIINDLLRETGPWTLPCTSSSMSLILDKINESPMPLPCVFLHPNTADDIDLIYPDEVGFKITLPYEEVVTNFGQYFKLTGSASYFEEAREDLLECSSGEEIKELFKKKKYQKSMIDKIYVNMQNIFNNRLVDISTGIPSMWKVKINDFKEYYNPITACILAGVVPVLVTKNLLNYDFYPPYYKYFLEDIWQRQTEDPIFRENNIGICILIDEIQEISGKEKNTIASATLKKLVTGGGPKRISTVVVSQNYSKIDDRIRTNLNYIFTFNNVEADIICKDYQIEKFWMKEIKKLRKLECVAYTSDHFIVYDADGNRTKQRGPIRGFSIPPLNVHKAPGMIE